MRTRATLGLLMALSLFPALANAQVLTFTDELLFLASVANQTTIEFEEVADTATASIFDQTGTFTRENVLFQGTDRFGNPAFGAVVGRDFYSSIGLGAFNLDSGDFVEIAGELPVSLVMDFSGVSPVGVGFRVDSRINLSQPLTVEVRTDTNGTIASEAFNVDVSGAGHVFFGAIGTGEAKVLDITVGEASSFAIDRVTFAPISTVPAPAALPILAGGLVALSVRLRRRRA